ncbi:MAG: NTP transferase domain-containing protein [Acidobacteria bacterium]|nr:NTP transferase domain-containing protein [Acidobacteriota bacterium]
METPILLIITAGGLGKRFGKPYPKQLEKIESQSILNRTARFFQAIHPDQTIVTCPEGFEKQFQMDLKDVSYPLKVIPGGATRFDSVKKAVNRLVDDMYASGSIVLVHDGVRPFLRRATVERIIRGVEECGAAAPFVPISGTIRRLKEEEFRETVDRKEVVEVTTPQGATLGIFAHCFNRQKLSFPDETTLLHAEGVPVLPVLDWHLNIKITTQADMETARVLWGMR